MAAASEDKTWLELQTWRLLLWNIWYFQDYGTKQETCEDLMWLKTELGRNVLGFSLSFLRCLYLSLKTGHGGSALAMFGRFCAVTSLQTFFFFFFSSWTNVILRKWQWWKLKEEVGGRTFCSASVFLSGERGGKKKKSLFSHITETFVCDEKAQLFLIMEQLKSGTFFKILEITVFVFSATTWLSVPGTMIPHPPVAVRFLYRVFSPDLRNNICSTIADGRGKKKTDFVKLCEILNRLPAENNIKEWRGCVSFLHFMYLYFCQCLFLRLNLAFVCFVWKILNFETPDSQHGVLFLPPKIIKLKKCQDGLPDEDLVGQSTCSPPVPFVCCAEGC